MTQQVPPYTSPEQPTPYGAAPAPARGTNTMAILSIVFAFVFSPLGIVFGVIGRKQTARTGEGGRGLATAGMVLSIVFVVIGIATAVIVGIMAASVASQVSQLPATPGVSQPASPSTPTVAPDQLGAEVARQANAEDVTCPQALPAQVGASTVCSGTLEGEQAQLGVTITAVEGTSVAFDIAKVG